MALKVLGNSVMHYSPILVLVCLYDKCRVSPRRTSHFCFGKSSQNHFGCVVALRVPLRFVDSGVAQTRYAQTMCALIPVSTAQLGLATKPEELGDLRRFLFMVDQCVELKQSPPVVERVRPWGRTAGVSAWCGGEDFED